MINKILLKLEDPKRPLLGPNMKALNFWGIFLPEKNWQRYFYIILHSSVFFFTFTEYIDIWFIKSDLKLLLTNVKITFLATISCCKIGTFLSWQSKWRSIVEYVTRADSASRNNSDGVDKLIIDAYTKYCRKITYLYWSLMTTTNVVVILQPIIKYFSSESYRAAVRNGSEPLAQVVSSWVPFNKTSTVGFLSASAYQIFGAVYGGGWITSFDTNAMVIMVFFKGELELLKRSCSKIYDTDSDFQVLQRIKACHKRHAELVKFAGLFNSCLSPVLFLYVIVCSVMLCASIYQTSMETNPFNKLLIAEYLVFGVTQLFLYCWHGNDVYYMSDQVMRGPYEGKWWLKSCHRRELLLLTGQLNKQIIFSAGPVVNLNISAFINIIKGAYSYYTLLK